MIWLDQVIYYVFLAIILLVSIWLHEYAHARTSYKLWDPTPVLQWRLTPNPFKHIYIFWLISVFLIWFWWWKPVVTNPIYYKDPRKWDVLVAFAWPIMNLLLAFLGMLIMMIYWKIVWVDIGLLPHSYSFSDVMVYFHKDLVLFFWLLFIWINLALAIFNMIPFPPLDGYRLIKIFWKKWTQWMEKNMTWFVIVFILLIFYSSPILSTYISTVTDIIYRLFFMLFSLIFY
jgi:Zn-dependent protease